MFHIQGDILIQIVVINMESKAGYKIFNIILRINSALLTLYTAHIIRAINDFYTYKCVRTLFNSI